MPIGEDAVAGYTFKIEIDGQVIAQFKEISGIESSREVIEHRENTMTGKEVIKKLPGKKSWSDITLKRGVTDNKVRLRANRVICRAMLRTWRVTSRYTANSATIRLVIHIRAGKMLAGRAEFT